MSERNYGLDLLRMAAMFMVILLHILGQGGILKQLPPQDIGVYNLKFLLVWFIEIFAYCAVNCYAILTGYNYYGKESRFEKIILFWLQAIFYTVGISLVFWLCGYKVPKDIWFRCFFPITTGVYWYVTAYFGLFLLIPVLNKGLATINNDQLKRYLVVIFIFISILPTIFMKDAYILNRGYSLIWLLFLFILGGAIRKIDIIGRISQMKAINLFFISILFTWIWKIFYGILSKPLSVKANIADMFIKYTSPTIILSGLFLFIFFSKMNVSNKKVKNIIKLFSPAAFGVYLIHLHPLIWRGIFRGFSVSFLKHNVLVMLGEIFLSALLIYIVCTVIDMIRIRIFNYLNLEEKLKFISKKIANLS